MLKNHPLHQVTSHETAFQAKKFQGFQEKTLLLQKQQNYKKAVFCHVLTHKEMETLKSKGVIFIVVKEPVQMVDRNVQVVYWSLNETSIHALSDLDLSKSHVLLLPHTTM